MFSNKIISFPQQNPILSSLSKQKIRSSLYFAPREVHHRVLLPRQKKSDFKSKFVAPFFSASPCIFSNPFRYCKFIPAFIDRRKISKSRVYSTSANEGQEDFESAKNHMLKLAQKLKINSAEDWYRVTSRQLDTAIDLEFRQLIAKKFDSSFLKLLKRFYSASREHEWRPWLFQSRSSTSADPMYTLFDDSVDKGFWTSKENRKAFFDWMASDSQLAIKHWPNDWYQVSRKQFVKAGQRGAASMLSHYYSDSLIKALQDLYPEFEWIPWLFKSGVPQGFWKDMENRRKYFEWLAPKLNVSQPSDWYQVNSSKIAQVIESESTSGSGSNSSAGQDEASTPSSRSRMLLSEYYNDSLLKALEDIYPNEQWLPWKFHSVPGNFWKDRSNRKKFFDWLGAKFGVFHPRDWAQVSISAEEVAELGGGGLIHNVYHDSLSKALADIYPEHKDLWKHVNWKTAPRSASSKSGIQATAKKHKSTSVESLEKSNSHHDDYDDPVAIEDVGQQQQEEEEEEGADDSWRTSVTAAAASELDLIESQSIGGQAGNNTLAEDDDSLRDYLEYLGNNLHIQTFEDWYRISPGLLQRLFRGYSIIMRQGGIPQALKKAYPGYPWDDNRFRSGRTKKSTQRWLWVVVKDLFPGHGLSSFIFSFLFIYFY